MPSPPWSLLWLWFAGVTPRDTVSACCGCVEELRVAAEIPLALVCWLLFLSCCYSGTRIEPTQGLGSPPAHNLPHGQPCRHFKHNALSLTHTNTQSLTKAGRTLSVVCPRGPHRHVFFCQNTTQCSSYHSATELQREAHCSRAFFVHERCYLSFFFLRFRTVEVVRVYRQGCSHAISLPRREPPPFRAAACSSLGRKTHAHKTSRALGLLDIFRKPYLYFFI